MAKDHSEDLMKSLMNKLYKTITGNDGNIKVPRNTFVTWLFPGIPFQPLDFEFTWKGFSDYDPTKEEGDAAGKSRDLYNQAYALSRLFDFVPKIPDDVDQQFINTMGQVTWSTDQDKISSVWNDVLKYSKVVHTELSEKEKRKLQKFRDLLTVTKEVEDMITEEKKTVSEPGPLTIAYTTKLNEYLEAADSYMDLVIDAQSAQGNSPEAVRRVAEFANKSRFMRKKLEAAYMAWVSQGYKNEYEQINAYIEQVTQKSMVLYKQDLQRKFEYGLLTNPELGTAGDFYYTTLIPGSFATAPKGQWPKFDFYENDFESNYSAEQRKWGGGGGISFGFFSIGGSAGGSANSSKYDQKATKFSATMEFIQVPIIRPWFEPGFFSMRAWTLDELWDLNFPDKKVSDGSQKPVGRLVAYPVTALFVRNVLFQFDEADSQSSNAESSIHGGGAFGWGPFLIGGSYSRNSQQGHTATHGEGGKIGNEGITLIGLINSIVPKAPNPNPNIKPEQFVGGEEVEEITR